MSHHLLPSDRPQLHTVASLAGDGGLPPVGTDGERPEPEDPEPLDWRRVQSALVRRKWLIAGVTAAGVLGGALVAHWVAPAYLAQATIWIDPRDRRESGPTPFQGARLLDPEAWIDLMRSYAVLDDVARSQQLYLRVDPSTPASLTAGLAVTDSFRPGEYRLVSTAGGTVYRLEGRDGVLFDEAPAGTPLGVPIGLRWTPAPGAIDPGDRFDFELVTLRDASADLADRLKLHIDSEGNLLRLQLEGTDRVRLAALLNALAERFVAVAGELKRQKTTELTGIIAAQLTTATQELTRAESTYQAFRSRTITLPVDHGLADPAAAGAAAPPSPVIGRFLELEETRTSLRRDREAIERALREQGAEGISVEALNAVAAVRNSPLLAPTLLELSLQESELRRLRARYTDGHPEVTAMAENVRTLRTRTIPALAEALARELGTQEAEAAGVVSSTASALRQIPARSLEESRLRRSVTLAEGLYNTLRQRHEEARLVEAGTIPDARILDRAEVPRRPIRDTSARILLVAFCGSAALGLAAALFLDRVDPHFRYPAQVMRELRLPILGAVPHVRGPRRGHEQVASDSGALVEAMRGLRMALLNEVADATPLLITVSSPGSRDGKSFVATHLARSFADVGYHTLLIDGDLRCGHLHQRFGHGRRPGLCEVLQGTVPVDEVLHDTFLPRLIFLPGGARLHQAPELLGGPELPALMRQLRERFDVIVCDSPPLTAGVDPYLLSVATGRLLLVLRTGVSHREIMAAKLAVLGRMPIQLLGVALNDVPMDDAYGYYSYHLAGYETHAEQEPAAVGAALV